MPPGSPSPLRVHPELDQFTWPQRRRLPEYQIVYITRGEGEFESEAAGKRKITAGNVFLTFPGDWHRYRPAPSTGWDEFWVGFDGEDADRLVRHGFISPKDRSETLTTSPRRLRRRPGCPPASRGPGVTPQGSLGHAGRDAT